MDRLLKTLFVLVLILFSLYIGVAGWITSNTVISNVSTIVTGPVEVDGIRFADARAAERYLKEKEIDKWFPWMRNPLPARFIACVGFALLGGAIGRLKRLMTETLPDFQMLVLPWVFSGAIGIVLYFLISVVSSSQSLFFILVCLIGGLFSEETYNWIETKLKTILELIFSKKT